MPPYVPSVEELRERRKQQAQGLPPVTVAQQTRLLQENEALKKSLADLTERGTKGLLSPTEFRATIMQLFQEFKVHPVRELLVMYHEENARGRLLTVEQRIHVMELLMQYTLPKMKTMEITGEVNQNITVTVKRYGEGTAIPVSTFTTPIRK